MNKEKLKEMLKDVWNRAVDIVNSTGPFEKPKLILYEPYVENGAALLKCSCKACGHTWIISDDKCTRYIYPNGLICPSCGCNKASSGPIIHGTSRYVHYRDDELTFVIEYSVRWEYQHYGEKDVFKWLFSEPEKTIYVSYILGFYDRAALVYNGETFSHAGNRIFSSMIEEWRNSGSLPANPQAGEDPYKRFQEIQNKNRQARPPRTPDKRLEYQPHTEMDISAFLPVIVKLESRHGAKSFYKMQCKKCGHEWTRETDYNLFSGSQEVKCPICGNEISNFGHGYYLHAYLLEATDLPDNDLLIRFGLVKASHFENAVFHEDMRWYLAVKDNKVSSKILVKSCGTWTSGKITDLGRWCYFYPSQSIDEIRQNLNKSSMARSGAYEALKEGLNLILYLKAFKNQPSVELIAKADLPVLLTEIVQHNLPLSYGKTANEVLGVTKSIMRIAREQEFSTRDMYNYKRIWDCDNSLTPELFQRINEDVRDFAAIETLHNEYGIAVQRILDYLQSVYDHQCIDKNEALSIWRDYLRMAKRCHFDLSDKSRKFPTSLKKEHDIAIFTFNKLRQELDKEMFMEQAKENAFLEYSYGNLFVKVPKVPEEVIEEATMQKNCLRSYIRSLTEGRTMVAFIRKKEEPDKAYVTVEIDMHKYIRQVKGYCNSNPKGKELNDFMEHWKKAKDLLV